MNKRYGMIERCKTLIHGREYYSLYNVFGDELVKILRPHRVHWWRGFWKEKKQYIETYKTLF